MPGEVRGPRGRGHGSGEPLGGSGDGAGDVAACQPQGKAAEAAASGSQPLGAGFDVPAAAGADEPVDDQHPQGALRSRPGQYQGPPGVVEEVAHAARCGPGVVQGLGGRIGGQAVPAGDAAALQLVVAVEAVVRDALSAAERL